MLTEIKNTILEQYQVRKNRKQKTAFINYVKSLCEEKGITCTVEKKGMSRNIVMGADPDSCKLVVGGHYDTCAVMPIPNFITPRNVFMFVLYQILLTLMLFLPCVILSAVVGYFTSPIIAGPIFSFSLLIMCGLMMFGPANRHTANDNTSGTVAVLNTMLTMTEEQRAGICFVLFDNEEIGLVGSSSFASMHKDVKKNIPVINLDCVSDGDNIFAKLPGKDKSSDFGTAFKAAVEASPCLCREHDRR